ncbi:hypothetical protein [Tsuneonella dongtanensis]|nr:hypothetical protein [Tsuneonella dongtanensis]
MDEAGRVIARQVRLDELRVLGKGIGGPALVGEGEAVFLDFVPGRGQ